MRRNEQVPRVVVTLGMIPARTPRGVVIAAARLGTNDLAETIAWWKGENLPVWGVIPERVGIAAGPEARLYRDGLDEVRRGHQARAAQALIPSPSEGLRSLPRCRRTPSRSSTSTAG